MLKASYAYLFLCFLSLFLLIGCHYQFGHGDLSTRYFTISVPYVDGDKDGELTANLIEKISTSGAFQYRHSGGELILKAKVIELRDENIGFRYDRKKQGNLKRAIVPTETRLNALVEVSVIEAATNKIMRGPTRITASIDFDHDYYYSRNAVNIFSLGQLSDIDAAYDAVMRPLNRCLAEKIVDYIINSW